MDVAFGIGPFSSIGEGGRGGREGKEIGETRSSRLDRPRTQKRNENESRADSNTDRLINYPLPSPPPLQDARLRSNSRSTFFWHRRLSSIGIGGVLVAKGIELFACANFHLVIRFETLCAFRISSNSPPPGAEFFRICYVVYIYHVRKGLTAVRWVFVFLVLLND